MGQAQITRGELSHDGTWFEWNAVPDRLVVWTSDSSSMVMSVDLDGARPPHWFGEWGRPSYDAWRRAFSRALGLALENYPQLRGIVDGQEERPPGHGRG